jgi:hypothetical protein
MKASDVRPRWRVSRRFRECRRSVEGVFGPGSNLGNTGSRPLASQDIFAMALASQALVRKCYPGQTPLLLYMCFDINHWHILLFGAVCANDSLGALEPGPLWRVIPSNKPQKPKCLRRRPPAQRATRNGASLNRATTSPGRARAFVRRPGRDRHPRPEGRPDEPGTCFRSPQVEKPRRSSGMRNRGAYSRKCLTRPLFGGMRDRQSGFCAGDFMNSH